MSVRTAISIVVGLDAEEARDASGRNLLERFRAGDLQGEPPDMERGLGDLDEWLYGDYGLRRSDPQSFFGHGAGTTYTRNGYNVIVGVRVKTIHADLQTTFDGPLSQAELLEAVAKAKTGLRALGIEAEPKVYLTIMVT